MCTYIYIHTCIFNYHHNNNHNNHNSNDNSNNNSYNNNYYYDFPGKEGPHAARHLLASSLEAALSAAQGPQPDPGAARCEKRRGDRGKFVYKPL